MTHRVRIADRFMKKSAEQLQKHAKQVKNNPLHRMPWNYQPDTPEK